MNKCRTCKWKWLCLIACEKVNELLVKAEESYEYRTRQVSDRGDR
jgi:sulfatase maturation enzyme AslB (radical SAM superfamily)